ncbi:zinc finger protein RFP-like isoform X2 [Pelodiscus sinensis]|uniref:zinc finger protein RFP-like isoform X2 n=1 Tax=Pelodiscus sinensis TaxID=13735 RepID=UPI003F6BF589
MAAANPLSSLREECRETFPQRTLRANRQLGNIAGIAQQLSDQAAGAGLCPAHREAFKLFCNQDRELICVICREAQAHRAHTAVPIEEAAQAYKEQIQTCLDALETERKELLEWRQDGQKQSQDYLGTIEAERQKIVAEFQQLRQFQEEQERLLLAPLEKLAEEIVKLQNENVAKLSEEISRLGDLIEEMGEKCQQPMSEFLQDIKSTWSRCEKEKCQKPVAVPQDLREQLGVSSQRNVCLQEAVMKFKEALPYQLSLLLSKAEKGVQVTLDPDLPNPCSLLSRDESVISRDEMARAKNMFHPSACVLGYKGFTSGRCYWEVKVDHKDKWVLGIAKESVIQEGATNLNPEAGIWALQRAGFLFWALTSPKTALIPLCIPSNIGVYLDYEGETVTFYDVTSSDRKPIFTFTSSFSGKIVPFFGSRPLEEPVPTTVSIAGNFFTGSHLRKF